MALVASFSLATLLCSTAPPRGAALHHAALHHAATFEEFVVAFGRTYDRDGAEWVMRRNLFEERSAAAATQNSDHGRLWTAALNRFSDWTSSELKALQGWRATSPHGTMLNLVDSGHRGPAKLPDDFPEEKDWSNLKALSFAPNQGGCGSCWAVTTAYLLRSHYEIQTSKVKPFSVQHLIDCVPNPDECGGQGGCEGATVELGLAYVSNISLGSLLLETDPTGKYMGSDQDCAAHTKSASLADTSGRAGLRGVQRHERAVVEESVSLTSFRTLPPNKPIPLLLALLDGPVAVSVAAEAWFLYSHGVFDKCMNPLGRTINHAVLMVGFGVDGDSGATFWRLMNSWGSEWGEHGFMRVLRRTPTEDAASCDYDTKPEVGTACKPYPKRSLVCGMCGILFDSVALQLSSAAGA